MSGRPPERQGLPRRAAVALCVVASFATLGCRKSRLPPRPVGAAVVVAPEAVADSGVTVVDEIEPNDLLANAQPLAPTGVMGVAVEAHLIAPPGSKSKDVDLYRVVVPAPAVVTTEPDGSASPRQRLAITVRPDAALSVSVDALDELGKTLVASVGTTPGDTEGIANLAVIPGTYFVRVKPGLGSTPGSAAAPGGAGATGASRRDAGNSSGGTGAAAYRLTVRLLPFEAGDEVEPNGKGALANDVVAGTDVAGFLAWRHDEDWYRLSLAGLPEGSVLSADLDAPDQVAASIAIYDSVEHKMIDQHGRKGDRVAVRNVRLPSSEPSVFVVVRADSGRSLDARYTLRLRAEEAKVDAELEPNDDPAHAVPLGDGNFLGYLGPGDVDVYRYSSTMPTELDFEVTPPERVDLKIEVIGDDGAVLMKVDGGKRREVERIANLYVAGSVLLRLSAGRGDGNLDEPYRISASSRPVTPGAEHEPNGTPALATQIADGETGSGLLFPRGDIDYWLTRTPVPPGGSLAIAVGGIGGLNLDVRVLTTAGRELARFRVGGDASAPTRVVPGTDGCCLVQVREASGRGANPRDRYTLSAAP